MNTRISKEQGPASAADARACQRSSLRTRASVVLATIGLCATAAALPSSALAASAPSVSTGGAQAVTYDSANLNGSVNPNGSDTSYYFQYGLTRSYGGQTTIADAGAGTHRVSITLPIGGLQPLTRYHYRLVAVNATSATVGADQTLLTTKVPLSLAILASPNPVIFGGTATVQGTLSGTESANRTVILQGAPFGSAIFQNVGNPELTTATGSFSFPVLGLQTVTQYRVVTTTNPPVVSPVTTENVAVQVVSHVTRAKRRGYARIYGTVTPAENGMQIGILRTVHGRGVLAGGTVLRPDGTSSSFSSVVRVKPGEYRVLVRVTTGAQVSNYGQPLLIR
jgi:hypothetical protein